MMEFEMTEEDTSFRFEDESELEWLATGLEDCAKDAFLNSDMAILTHCVQELRENQMPCEGGISSYLSTQDTTMMFGAMMSLLIGYHKIYGKDS